MHTARAERARRRRCSALQHCCCATNRQSRCQPHDAPLYLSSPLTSTTTTTRQHNNNTIFLPRHIDLGRAAFRLLADEKWGVVGLKWRAVSCDRLGSSGRTAAPAAPAPVQQQKPQQQGQQWGQQQQAAPVQQQQPQQQQWRLALPQELATSPARSWGHGGGGEWQREAQRYASRYGGSGGGGARWGTPRIGRW